MRSKILQTTLVGLLLSGAMAFAQAPGLSKLYRKHFAQLAPSYHHHLRFLMEDSSRALRVLVRYGWLAPASEATPRAGTNAPDPPNSPEPAEGKEKGDAAAGDDPTMALRQLLTAARELRSVATALQRSPLPPDGHWLAAAQHVKKPAARLSALASTATAGRLRGYVVKAQAACYECHRIYGGPIDAKELFAEGADRYTQPVPLPTKTRPPKGRAAASSGRAKGTPF